TAERLVLEKGLERFARTLVLRIDEEDLAVVLERARRIVRVLFERLAEAELEVHHLAFVHVELDAATENVDVRLPTLELTVEDVERLQRVRVGRLIFEHAVVGVDRAIEVLHLGLVELGYLVRDRLLFRRIAREIAAFLVDAEKVRETRGVAVEALE